MAGRTKDKQTEECPRGEISLVTMHKGIEKKEDGRLLIFYSFIDELTESSDIKNQGEASTIERRK